MNEALAKNEAAGLAFLEKNRKRPGVKETQTGLQYEVIKEGSGARPNIDSTVEVHYVGTLLDGTEFDSSRRRRESISFPLSGVIAGWTEGLQYMTIGSTYKFYIPGILAYGKRAMPPHIGPGALLVFEVELISFE